MRASPGPMVRGGHGPPIILPVCAHASLADAMLTATGGTRPDLALVALPRPVQGDRALLTNCCTGLGVALWVPGAGAIPTEAGHASLAGATAEEDALIAALRARFGHASAERALCGPGLRSLAELAGERAEALFLDLLAGHLGSLALATGARGGVYLAGNICNARAEALAAPAFHARFTAKGRFAPWLAVLPLRLITLAEPGLAALAGLATAYASKANRPDVPAPSGR